MNHNSDHSHDDNRELFYRLAIGTPEQELMKVLGKQEAFAALYAISRALRVLQANGWPYALIALEDDGKLVFAQGMEATAEPCLMCFSKSAEKRSRRNRGFN